MKTLPKLTVIGVVLGLALSNTSLAEPACPSQNFHTFIKSFAADEVMQKAFTANPLTLIYLVSDDVGYQVKKEQVDPHIQDKQYFLPVYESKKWSTPIKASKVSKYHYRVFADVDNAVLRYDFKKQNRCWYLTHYKNMGL